MFSTTLSEDGDGNTIISGNSSLGSAGCALPLPGLFYTAIFVITGLDSLSATGMVSSYVAGFVSGAFLERNVRNVNQKLS